MNDGEAPKGDSPQELTEEEAALQHMAQDIALQLQGLLGHFAPTFPEKDFPRLLQLMVREQVQIGNEILPSISDADAIEQAPRIGVRVYQKAGPGKEPDPTTAIMLIVNKHIGDDPKGALETACTLALLLQPGVRGLLRVCGFHYDFVQVKSDKTDTTEPSRIILSS